MKKENNEALNEMHKSACMGCDAIKYIIDKVSGKDLKEELKKEYNDYKEIKKKIETIYKDKEKGLPQETNIINKAFTWYGIEMQTLVDDTDSKIAELLIKGTNMGIIEGRKIKNNKNLDSKIKKIVDEYVTMQDHNLEKLKKYL